MDGAALSISIPKGPIAVSIARESLISLAFIGPGNMAAARMDTELSALLRANGVSDDWVDTRAEIHDAILAHTAAKDSPARLACLSRLGARLMALQSAGKNPKVE